MIAVARHLRNYLSAGLVASVIGLITFPLLTRSLTVEEYGWLGLVSATITAFVSFGKLGLQSAMVRFFSEARAKGSQALNELLSNTAGAALLLGMLGLGLWLLYSFNVAPRLPDGDDMVPIFYVAAALVPIKILFSISTSVLKADERSGFLSTTKVVDKAAKLVLIVLIIFTFGATAEWIMASIVLVEALLLGFVLYKSQDYLGSTRPTVSLKVLSPMVAFGIPAMAGETMSVVLEIGDRYVIQAFLGGEALGQYSAAVNITLYLDWVVILALTSAIVPHYIRLYEEKGREATLSFLNNAFELYIAIGLGIFAVFSAAAPSLILLLAGDRYEPGLVVIPWFAAALVMQGSICIVASGLYIDKRPRALAKWFAGAFVINLALNLLTVPIWGLVAAAIVTFFSMSLQCLGVYWESHKRLPVRPPVTEAVCGLIAAGIALWTARQIDTGNVFADMVACGTVSLTLYATILLSLCKSLRGEVFTLATKLIERNTP